MKAGAGIAAGLRRRLPSPGAALSASLLLCAGSGLGLALVFRPGAPYDSLALLGLGNPAGTLVRSVHVWSTAASILLGAVCLVSGGGSRGKAARSVVGPAVAFGLGLLLLWVVLSGAMLRGDPAGDRLVAALRELLRSLPFGSGVLVSATLGHLAGVPAMYLQHLCFAALLVVVAVRREARGLPSLRAFAWVGAPVAVLALLLVPGLASPGDSGWPFVSIRAYFPAPRARAAQDVPVVAGGREGCLSCHAGMTGFAPAHDPRAFGCAGCHGGNRFTLNKTLAHAGLRRTPGDLSVVDRTCATAQCHADIAQRVRDSLMNTMSGVVAVDKVVLGESRDLDARHDVARLGHSPADTHLRQLCASCHLGQDKPEPAPLGELTRGGGCSACHLDYGPAARDELRARGAPGRDGMDLKFHPDISVRVPAQACFGCHSRSARISTNYEGWHETLLTPETAKAQPAAGHAYRFLDDGRVFERRPADVHHDRGMACIDCHLAAEIMGDGHAPAHQEAAVKIACIDCHNDRPPVTAGLAELDPETRTLAALRGLDRPGRRFVRTAAGVAYPNVYVEGGATVLQTKTSGRLLKPKPLLRACGRDIAAHGALECRACHTAWAPQCVSCHTSFDPQGEAWDHLAGIFTRGAWQEQPGEFRADPPTLGVEEIREGNGTVRRVGTFIPGMILSLRLPATPRTEPDRFHRLFAPTSAHTTATQARDCRSCHADPLALGYGRGRLTYRVVEGAGEWSFEPAFPKSPRDGLPADAWIAFLQEPDSRSATRRNVRPFSLAEQRRILLVGACLQCHSENEPRLRAVFEDFGAYRKYLRPPCRLPAWAPRGEAGNR